MFSRLRQRFQPSTPLSATSFQPDAFGKPVERKRIDSSLQVLMCRFINGKLVKEIVPVANTKYLAISHVWGEGFKWQEVLGLRGEVPVSTEKVNFLEQQLNSIVGDDYFWMDILCVDQKDKAARIAVTQHIPTIFRMAERTIVVRGTEGFQNCCGEAIATVDPLVDDLISCSERLTRHREAVHPGRGFREDTLSRLWVYQEIILSNNLQFVRCNEVRQINAETNNPGTSEMTVFTSIIPIATGWFAYSNPNTSDQSGVEIMEFLHAFFKCGFASRAPVSIIPDFPGGEFIIQDSSVRRTTKSRDFILAVMPQYTFYTIPDNAKSMTFGQLFINCFQQLRNQKYSTDFAPLVKAPASENIPEPLFLGDLVKLFCGPRLLTNPPLDRNLVRIERIDGIDNSEVVRRVQKCVHYSKMIWSGSLLGELRELSSTFLVPSLWETLRSPKPLRENVDAGLSKLDSVAGASLIAEASTYDVAARRYIERLLHMVGRSNVLRLAALISVGFGASAFEWSKRNLAVVSVKFRGRSYLAMVPIDLLDQTSYRFHMVKVPNSWWMNEAVKERFALVAWTGKDKDEPQICLFPPDQIFIGWKFWKKWF